MKGISKHMVQKQGSRWRRVPVAVYLLFAAIVATPAFFLFGYVYNRILMAIRQSRLKNSQYDFWLTSEQCMAYLKKTNRYNEIKKRLTSATGDAKSAARDEYQPMLDALEKDLDQLHSIPRQNWKQFRETVARTNAFLLCLITWCAVILYFQLPLNEGTVGAIIDQYTRLGLYLQKLVTFGGNPQPPGRELLLAIASATFWPILLYLPFKQLARPLTYFYTKRPDDVNFGSVSASLDNGQVKAAFVATVTKNLEPVIEILDDPGS